LAADNCYVRLVARIGCCASAVGDIRMMGKLSPVVAEW
jgi:hypothetical protein